MSRYDAKTGRFLIWVDSLRTRKLIQCSKYATAVCKLLTRSSAIAKRTARPWFKIIKNNVARNKYDAIDFHSRQQSKQLSQRKISGGTAINGQPGLQHGHNNSAVQIFSQKAFFSVQKVFDIRQNICSKF